MCEREGLLVKKSDSWYKATEKLLYTYPGFAVRIMALEGQLEDLRESLTPQIIGRYEVIEGKTYGVSNKVEAAAIERIENKRVLRLERKIKNLQLMKEIVEKSLDVILSAEQRELVKRIYWDKTGWEEICDSVGYSRQTFYDKKNEIVKHLSWCFGYGPEQNPKLVGAEKKLKKS